MEFLVRYYNRTWKVRTRIVPAPDAQQAKLIFQSTYENRFGFCPDVIEVIPWD